MSSSQNTCVLPKDVIMEILSRLSVNDLMRCKCVSKGWKHLISDSIFVKLHLQRSSKNTHMLLTFADHSSETRRDYALVCPVQDLLHNPLSTLQTLYHKHEHRPFNRDYSIIGVCNGLVCFLGSYAVDEFHRYYHRYWVRFANPATRAMSEDSPHICFDPSDYKYPYLFMFGFGYDDSSDTYQVVFFDNNKNESQKLEIRVYSLGDSCWKNTLTCDPVPTLTRFGTFVSGTLNWLAFPKSRADDEGRNSVKMNELEIFCYDLKKEKCSYFSMPDGTLEVYRLGPKLEVLKGCLCLSHHYKGEFFVWLKRVFSDEKSWSKLLTFNYGCDIQYQSLLPFIPSCHMEILYVSENDEVVLLARTDIAEFFRYNNRENRIHLHEFYDYTKRDLFSYDYVLSLVLPYKN